MAKTVVVLSGGDLGNEKCMFRCDLSDASSPVEVDWCTDNGRPSGWESTQYQCADTSHRWSGLADVAMQIAADGVQLHADEFSCDVLDPDDMPFDDRVKLGLVDNDIVAIADVLDPYGDRMAGGDVEATAHEWRDHSFTADEVDEWCEIGCWNPATAAVWRESGLTPEIVATAAEVLLLSLPEGSDPRDSYTDGCPIYSCCNHDTDPEVMVGCCRDVVREFDTMTLQDFVVANPYTMVFVSGVGHPAGNTQPAGHPDMDFVERLGLLDLEGEIDEHGDWQWDGEGNPLDERGNTIQRVTAYVSVSQWKTAVELCEGGSDDTAEEPKLQIEANESAELLALSLDDCSDDEPYRSECTNAWWDAFYSATEGDARLSGVEFVRPRGNRLMLCQWNGAQFAWKRAVLGSFAVPTQDQQDAIDAASTAADLAAAEVWGQIQTELAETSDDVDG